MANILTDLSQPAIALGKQLTKYGSLADVWDYNKLWDENIQPMAFQFAASQVDPEAQRNYNTSYQTYMNNLASSGGGRFGGAGMGGVGQLQAESERQRGSDIGSYLDAIKSNWYTPTYNTAAQSWLEASTQGINPKTNFQKPSWQNFYDLYGDQAPEQSTLFV